MLTCLPLSICSWDFRVLGAAAGPASTTCNFLTEQGAITLGQAEYAVVKHGPFSGRWTLEHGGVAVADAHKPSAMFRTFELECARERLTAKAQSALTRSFDLLSGTGVVGTIRPAHAFTRRATIECRPDVSDLAQLFAFWLVVVTWRRAANSNS